MVFGFGIVLTEVQRPVTASTSSNHKVGKSNQTQYRNSKNIRFIIFYIPKRKNALESLKMEKDPEEQRKTMLMDDRIISLVKKNLFTVGQIKNTLQEVE